MADFRFNCPECDQELEAPEDMTGETVECPSCQTHFEVPASAPAASAAAVNHPAFTGGDDGQTEDVQDSACPSCGSEMAPDAVLCVQCGYNVKLGKKIDTSFE